MAVKPWIGVDLDGTLAYYESGKGVDSVGEPIPLMVSRVRQWLREGHPDFGGCKDIRIFTARVAPVERDHQQIWKQQDMIKEWCIKHLGQALPVTYMKDYEMLCLYDDRVIQVERNTGRILGDIV